jgi:hypothetical protein
MAGNASSVGVAILIGAVVGALTGLLTGLISGAVIWSIAGLIMERSIETSFYLTVAGGSVGAVIGVPTGLLVSSIRAVALSRPGGNGVGAAIWTIAAAGIGTVVGVAIWSISRAVLQQPEAIKRTSEMLYQAVGWVIIGTVSGGMTGSILRVIPTVRPLEN